MDKLKPCPFCGGEAKTVVDFDMVDGRNIFLSAYCECGICGIYQRIKFDGTQKGFADYIDAFNRAISLWNQRT